MADPSYLGVYSTSEIPPVLGAALRPMVKRKRLWFVWEDASGHYRVQALNAILQPMAAPRMIKAAEFEARFTHEPSCPAVPPEAAPQGPQAPQPPPAGQADSATHNWALRADDPDLLRSWLTKAVPSPAPDLGQGFSPIQEFRLARLVEDALQVPLPESTDAPLPVEAAGAGDAAFGPGGAERSLRADFAMALLKMKQGKQDEARSILEALINWNGERFGGAAELFSEFGLNLRRIGVTDLALKAHLRALELTPNDERVHFNLARVYHDLKDYDKAQAHLKRALEIEPGFITARQFLSFLTAKEPLPS